MSNITGMVSGVITVIIGFVVIFYIVGGTSTTLTTAAGNVSNSGLPLAGLFASNGVVLIAFMAGILLAVIGLALGIGSYIRK